MLKDYPVEQKYKVYRKLQKQLSTSLPPLPSTTLTAAKPPLLPTTPRKLTGCRSSADFASPGRLKACFLSSVSLSPTRNISETTPSTAPTTPKTPRTPSRHHHRISEPQHAECAKHLEFEVIECSPLRPKRHLFTPTKKSPNRSHQPNVAFDSPRKASPAKQPVRRSPLKLGLEFGENQFLITSTRR
jgi:hypothetical protein